jgi:hypothetical protein
MAKNLSAVIPGRHATANPESITTTGSGSAPFRRFPE